MRRLLACRAAAIHPADGSGYREVGHEGEDRCHGSIVYQPCPPSPRRSCSGCGYDPLLSEGARQAAGLSASTFRLFRSAEEVRDFFDYTAGRRQLSTEVRPAVQTVRGSITPAARIVEDRLAAYEVRDLAFCFSRRACHGDRGDHSHITRPGGVILHSQPSPLWRLSETLISRTLSGPPAWEAVGFADGVDEQGRCKPAAARCDGRSQAVPNVIHDRDALEPAQHDGRYRARAAAVSPARSHRGQGRSHRARRACDNTLLGPVFRRDPLALGAEISSFYSLTKYVGLGTPITIPPGGVSGGEGMLMKRRSNCCRGAISARLNATFLPGCRGRVALETAPHCRTERGLRQRQGDREGFLRARRHPLRCEAGALPAIRCAHVPSAPRL